VKPEVVHLGEGFAEGAADWIERLAVESLAARGRFRLGLCGGSSPKPVYAALARRPLPWDHVWITFGDERCVPPDHAESNYRMAREQLLDKIEIPEGNILRMPGELRPDSAAEEYGRELAGRAVGSGEARYAHDLLLLGLGEDGHTASLFPGTAALEETERDVAENFVPKLGAHRITLTYPAIHAARRVMFLVADRSKHPVVERILAGGSDDPAARVRPEAVPVVWLLGWGPDETGTP
jgi:6-phosphogluconolactonase